jgi:hypothetical protein
MYINSSEVALDTDKASDGTVHVSGEKHGCTLIKLNIILNYFYRNKRDIKSWCYSAVMNKPQFFHTFDRYGFLSFTFNINITIPVQSIKQCALYTILDLKQELFT